MPASAIDGGAAAAVVVALEEARRSAILKPLGRIVNWGISGVDPKIMGSGPVPASKAALQRAGADAGLDPI